MRAAPAPVLAPAESRWKARPSPGGDRARSGWDRSAPCVPRRGRSSAFAALCVGALIGYFAYPTYPTYDSFYALLWGRDLLHVHLPDFRVYRGPTEHPLAIAFGAVLLDLRRRRRAADGARLDRLVRRARRRALPPRAAVLRPLVGLVAALLVLSRFFLENLAAQGYLDITYLALIVWAVVLEVQKPAPRTGGARAAGGCGLLRPDAWLLAAPTGCGARAEQVQPRRSAHAAAVHGACRDWPAGMGARRCDRHGRAAVLADLDGRPRAGTRTHAGPHRRDRLAVDVHRADRQAAGAARGDRRYWRWRSG